jgi:hypothetical protein
MDFQRRCKTLPNILVLDTLWALDGSINFTSHFLITFGTYPKSSALDNVELMVKYRLPNCPDVVFGRSSRPKIVTNLIIDTTPSQNIAPDRVLRREL